MASTNLAMLADDGAEEGDWLIAREQTQGRGRQGRSWHSLDGNFFGSTVIALGAGDPPPQSLSMVAGLALAEAIDAASPGQPIQLKWPNDVMLGEAKIAGILLERAADRVVAGFGVNLGRAPAIEGRATAALGGTVTAQSFAPLLAASFARMVELWRSSTPALFAQAWLARAHPAGTILTVHGEDGEDIRGRFDGLADDGALRLTLDGGEVRTIHAGDVSIG